MTGSAGAPARCVTRPAGHDRKLFGGAPKRAGEAPRSPDFPHSSLFIWVNSIAGLVGYFTKVRTIPSLGFILAAAAIIGGIIGSHLGSRRFAVRVISLCLATVLVIAGIKLIFTR